MYSFLVILHFSFFPAYTDSPTDNDHLAAEKEMVHGVKRVNRA